MSPLRFILRSLVYYRRTNIGVAAGVAVATAIIVGALLVGDSVRYSLKRIALDRLGQVDYALPTGDRLVTTGLVDRMQASMPEATFAGVLQLPGVAVKQGGSARVNGIQILGVDNNFWSLAPDPTSTTPPADDGVILNQRLAEALGVQQGDRVLLRIAKPSALPRDIPIGSEVDDTITLDATVTAIAPPEAFGLYSLQGSQIPPFNAFVPMKRLQEAAGVGERLNTSLLSINTSTAASAIELDTFDLWGKLHGAWTIADIGIAIEPVPDANLVELRSRRVFIDPVVVNRSAASPGHPFLILTYFVNAFVHEGRSAPYSMVSTRSSGLDDSEIEIVQWLADDLAASPGDTITLRYFVLGEDDTLIEESRVFTVKRIVPTEGPNGDRQLMPDFPGISDADSTNDWEPGIPIDLSRIRDNDEEYWEVHRGAPKAFVSLEWARKTWGNRFGDITQIRWERREAFDSLERFRNFYARNAHPNALGLHWQPIRAQALSASQSGTDFGGLFIGLSFFIVIAALLLVGLMFVFGVEQRAGQTGVLMAIGYSAKRVRRLWIAEGAVLATIGTAIGVPLGFAYTKAVLWALTTQWPGAIAQTRLWFHAEPATVAIGAVVTLIVALLTMVWVLRRQARSQPRELMAAKFGADVTRVGVWNRWAGIACMIGAIGLGAAVASSDGGAAGGFFAAASLLLIGTILLARSWIGGMDRSAERMSLGTLARRNVARRRGRSVAVVALLACGCFLVIAINAFRSDPTANLDRKTSGAGGFDTFAELTIPLHDDITSEAGAEDLGIDRDVLTGSTVIAMRRRGGDDASCLNLNAPQSPPLLGVDPRKLTGRFAFARTAEGAGDDPWSLLSRQAADGTVPAIVDDAVAQWIIKKGIGDTIEYVDDHGESFRIKIVATLAPSIMQGHLVIDEAAMKKRFPSVSGARVLLIDAPADRVEGVRDELAFTLVDYGINLTDTGDRLRLYAAVEQTYLTIFGVLGSLGVLLGSVGLGLVLVRNVMERRSELALMRALGFVPGRLRRLIVREHLTLALLGLACGGIAAGLAIAPALARRGSDLPWVTILGTLAGVLVSAGVWTVIAARLAARGRLVRALRSE